MTSDDLETWTPTEVKLRGFIKRSGFSPVLDGDYDSGPYQIIEMRLSEGKNAKFFRIDLTTP